MRASRSRLTGTLRSAQKPTQEQLHRFEEFLARTYRRKVPLAWEEEDRKSTRLNSSHIH